MSGGQERRDKRQFEPPPWEQDAFDRFQKEREDREKDAALEAALSNLAAEPREEDASATESSEVLRATRAPEEVTREYVIPAAQMEELLAGLRDEEPRARANFKGITNVVTGALGVGGLVFVIWAGVLLSRAGSSATGLQIMASLLVMVWGFMLIGFAVLLWRKHNL